MALKVANVLLSVERKDGGISACVPPLLEQLGSLGVYSHLFSVRSSSSEINLPNSSLVSSTMVDGYSNKTLRFIWSRAFYKTVLQYCKETKVQLMHNHGVWGQPHHAATSAARKLDLPLLISPHGMLTQWSLKHKRIKKSIAWYLYQRRDSASAVAFHVTSESEAIALRQLGLKQPIALIPNVFELPPSFILREKNSDKRTLLFLSRIHKIKGLIHLVEAWQQLRPKNWRVIIAGPDDDGYRAIIKDQIARLNIQQDFEFVGTVTGESKWSLYQQADLFVLPSYSENFGIVVAEALACGVPVITTTATPWAELVDYRCGWWVDCGTATLKNAIAEAISLSATERLGMGQRGQALISKRYNATDVANKMKMLYCWLTGGGVTPASLWER